MALSSTVVPFRNSTVPVGVVESLESAEVTVAVSVTGWPETTELLEEATAVVLATRLVKTTSLPSPPV